MTLRPVCVPWMLVLAIGTLRAASLNITEIVLPANPTDQQVAAYVKSLDECFTDEVVHRLRSVRARTSAPEGTLTRFKMGVLTDRFKAVPSTHLVPLIERINARADHPDYSTFCRNAVEEIAARKELDEAAKKAVLKGLPKYGRYITVIEKNNWIAGNEVAIIKSAKSTSDNDAPLFLTSLGTINSPESVAVLQKIFVGLESAHAFETAHRKLSMMKIDGLDWSVLIPKAWKKLRSKHQNLDLDRFALIAARYGEKDALVLAATRLKQATYKEMFLSTAQQLAKLTNAPSGDPDEIADFVIREQKRLHWNAASSKYEIK